MPTAACQGAQRCRWARCRGNPLRARWRLWNISLALIVDDVSATPSSPLRDLLAPLPICASPRLLLGHTPRPGVLGLVGADLPAFYRFPGWSILLRSRPPRWPMPEGCNGPTLPEPTDIFETIPVRIVGLDLLRNRRLQTQGKKPTRTT